MARKLHEKGLVDVAGGGGGGGAFRSPKWMGQPRPAEMPKSKMELRAVQRQVQQPEIDRAKEAAREERKKRFNIRYNKGGMVKDGQKRDYCK